MTNIAHAALTGAELHEPKGITGASLGTVYVANGSGSGTWANVGTSSFTGMIADFTWPVVQDGWLELDGTDINTTTYTALYNVMTIQQTGTRANGVATITSLASTANMRVGYYVFGTGIPSGTTILTIDGGTQITMSGNAVSSGSSTVILSPWLLNTGTIRLPDVSTAGRYRRSRTASTAVGQTQADQNKAHTHSSPLTTSTESADHTHTFSGSTGTESATHTHANGVGVNILVSSAAGAAVVQPGSSSTGAESNTHTHAYSGTTSGKSATHTHSVTIPSDGGTEARPTTLIVMTCVKT